ncbi:MAG: Na/Pi cotransporter family protein [Fimbriimonadales bacterium]|nr:Na/Pi cotransporter family protein [Fimbriimonadales bacterium]
MMVAYLLGGVGLFILGMSQLTEGLKSLAGDALRRALTKLTGGSIRGFLAGVGITAVVQSSSATTVMTIGFVSAGLISLTSAVSIIIGANLGTTSTGWIVSLLGLKFSVSIVALPLVGVGVGFRMFGHGRLRAFGTALAGFGLIFVGIDTLQEGMADLSTRFDLQKFVGSGIVEVLALIAVGAAMTIVMQSSSAAVATTLTALNAGAIGLHQAGALVIGQNIGTTVTAAIAAIGASAAAKRTALAHILFNLGTGVIAVLALPALGTISEAVRTAIPSDPAAVSIAAFHTAFNAIGVLIFLPLVRPFSMWVGRLIPETKSPLVSRLDRSVTQTGPVAIEAAKRTLADIAAEIGKVGATVIRRQNGRAEAERTAKNTMQALEAVRKFMAATVIDPNSQVDHKRHVANLHAVDHLAELSKLLLVMQRVPESLDSEIQVSLARAFELLNTSNRSDDSRPATGSETIIGSVRDLLRDARHQVLSDTAIGKANPEESFAHLDFIRWADQCLRHVGRTAFYLYGPETIDDQVAY